MYKYVICMYIFVLNLLYIYVQVYMFLKLFQRQENLRNCTVKKLNSQTHLMSGILLMLLNFLILISKMVTFKFEDQCLIPESKLSLQRNLKRN